MLLTLFVVICKIVSKLCIFPSWARIAQAVSQPIRGLTGGFLLLQNFSVAISVSPRVCFILVLILISLFLR